MKREFAPTLAGSTGASSRQMYVNNAILVLWLRSCRLYTNSLLGVVDPDLDKQFFSSADATPA